MTRPLSYEKWVTRLVDNVATHLDLAGWVIQVEFSSEEKEDRHADNTINTTYLHSSICFYPPAKRDFDSGHPERVVIAVVHELVHVLLDPLHGWMCPYLSSTTTPFFMETLEQQTQKLTMVLLKTLPKSIIPPTR